MDSKPDSDRLISESDGDSGKQSEISAVVICEWFPKENVLRQLVCVLNINLGRKTCSSSSG